MRDFTDVLVHLQAETTLVISFFAGFSRFEFALKYGGFACNAPYGHHIEADWKAFARHIRPHFKADRTVALKTAITYLETNPPQRHILDNRKPKWIRNDDVDDEPYMHVLTLHLRMIRNNLFHGGKYPGAPPKPVERDKLLLQSGIVFLEELLFLCEKRAKRVKSFFEQSLPPIGTITGDKPVTS